MSFEVVKVGNKHVNSAHAEYLITSEADLTKIPACAVGSIAYTADMNNIWTKSANGGWTKSK